MIFYYVVAHYNHWGSGAITGEIQTFLNPFFLFLAPSYLFSKISTINIMVKMPWSGDEEHWSLKAERQEAIGGETFDFEA